MMKQDEEEKKGNASDTNQNQKAGSKSEYVFQMKKSAT